MHTARLLLVTLFGTISLIGSVVALFSGNVGGAVLLFLITSGLGLIANRLTEAPATATSTRDLWRAEDDRAIRE